MAKPVEITMKVQHARRHIGSPMSEDENVMVFGQVSNIDGDHPRIRKEQSVTAVCFGDVLATVKSEIAGASSRRVKAVSTSGDLFTTLKISDPESLVPWPDNLSLNIQRSLTSKGLLAYKAVHALLSDGKEHLTGDMPVTCLIAGQNAHALWFIQLAKQLVGTETKPLNGMPAPIRYIVADTSTTGDELLDAIEHNNQSWLDVIHWDPKKYEQDLLEQTAHLCPNGIQILVDFAGNRRVIARCRTLLSQDGVVITVAAPHHCMSKLKNRAKFHSICITPNKVDIPDLQKLSTLMEDGQICPPSLHHSVEEEDLFDECIYSDEHENSSDGGGGPVF